MAQGPQSTGWSEPEENPEEQHTSPPQPPEDELVSENQTLDLSDADREAIQHQRRFELDQDASRIVPWSPPQFSPESGTHFLAARLGHRSRYYLESLIGRGGMGEVYRAFDTHVGRTVAIKIMALTTRARHSRELLKRFEQEISISARFNSPHIVQVTDLGLTDEGHPYFVMEYLQGETLRKRLRRDHQLSLEQAVPIFVQICEGLHYAHTYGVIHRDLKPENIFLCLGPLGELVKIIDFGIAKITKSEAGKQWVLTESGNFVGTLQYASPEQCEGADIDTRTDVYTLGILLYECLSGVNPFGIDQSSTVSAYRWMDCHINRTPIPIRQHPHCHEILPQVEDILSRCLNKHPSERFSSVIELRNCLKRALSPISSGNDDLTEDEKTTDKGQLTFDRSEPDDSDLLFYPSGPIPLDAPVYIPFPIEEQAYREIHRPGSLIRIKAPKEMGKTSLLLRIIDHAQSLGYRAVSLSLDQADQAILADLNRLLRWMCISVSKQLELEPNLERYWDEEIGSKVSCTQYFRGYILKQVKAPLLLAFDEINQIFEYPQVAKDFLPLLRFWFEETKRQSTWRELRMIVVHSTDIYVPLQLKQSPFNVGTPIQIEGFSLKQAGQLAERYGLRWRSTDDLERLMALVGGHPALIHLAIYHLKFEGLTVEHLLETAATLSGIFGYHLQRHLVIIQEQPQLMEALQQIMTQHEPMTLKSATAHKLNSMGLVRQMGDQVSPSCELYRLFFSKNL